MAGLRGCAAALLLALSLIALIAQPAAAAGHKSHGERCGSFNAASAGPTVAATSTHRRAPHGPRRAAARTRTH